MAEKNSAKQIVIDRAKFLGTPPQRVVKAPKDLIADIKKRIANRAPLTDVDVKNILQNLIDIESSMK